MKHIRDQSLVISWIVQIHDNLPQRVIDRSTILKHTYTHIYIQNKSVFQYYTVFFFYEEKKLTPITSQYVFKTKSTVACSAAIGNES